MLKASIFVDPRITDEVVDHLKSWGFESVKVHSSSRQPLIGFKGKEEDIEEWAGEFNRFGITSESVFYS